MSSSVRSIYIVHDEVKDKAFELELSWVGEGSNRSQRRPGASASCCHGNNTNAAFCASFQLRMDDTHSFPKMSERKQRSMPR